MSQLLVASGIAGACGLLVVAEWFRARAHRARIAQARLLPVPRQQGPDRLTPLSELTGFRDRTPGT